MIDPIEALRDVSVQHKLRFVADAVVDRLDRIVSGAAWSEPIAVWLKDRFPFGLKGSLDQSLGCSIRQGRDTQRALLIRAGFGDPNPSGGPRPSWQMQGLRKSQPLRWR